MDNSMVTAAEAEKIILAQFKDFGTETVSFNDCAGRVLAENILADRDMPPFNRVTMDGIAINSEAFKTGTRSFKIIFTQPAGVDPVNIKSNGECVEIMTGAALPPTTDTVIPYEMIEIKNGIATVKTETILFNRYIHKKGKDKKQHEILAEANQFITPTIITIAAAVGKTSLRVKKLPAIIIISTGDELVDINETPSAFKIRSSNDYTLRAVLQQYALHPDMLHLPDEPLIIEKKLQECIDKYDIIILSGGVSMGKFDHVPLALENLQVEKLFHKIKQRPGKPFWFGVHAKGTRVFAFPGNTVSTFMCFYRYFLPWLKTCWQIKLQKSYAILNEDFSFKHSLQYFLQVKLNMSTKGELLAVPLEGNGSGDFVNLLQTDAFLELPLERNDFKKGEIFQAWIFNQMQ
jgi:molybdopterin molybdotransferase